VRHDASGRLYDVSADVVDRGDKLLAHCGFGSLENLMVRWGRYMSGTRYLLTRMEASRKIYLALRVEGVRKRLSKTGVA
jgi:hypothetical protein